MSHTANSAERPNPTAKPILLDFPDHLRTERLLIRAPRPGDGAVVNTAIRESLEKLRPWMPWAQRERTVEETEEYVRGAAARFLKREDLPLLLFRREDGLFVGSASTGACRASRSGTGCGPAWRGRATSARRCGASPTSPLRC